MRLRKFLLLSFCLVGLSFLGGCYETSVMIVTADEAEAVPGLEGTYLPQFNYLSGPQESPDAERLAIKKAGNGNDYTASSEAEAVGIIRFRKLKDDIYLAQVDSGPMPLDPQTYDVGFVQVTGRTLAFLMPVPPGIPLPKDGTAAAFSRWLESVTAERLEAKAEKHAEAFKVSLSEREGGSALNGNKDAVINFLLSHRDWAFVPFATFTKDK